MGVTDYLLVDKEIEIDEEEYLSRMKIAGSMNQHLIKNSRQRASEEAHRFSHYPKNKLQAHQQVLKLIYFQVIKIVLELQIIIINSFLIPIFTFIFIINLFSFLIVKFLFILIFDFYRILIFRFYTTHNQEDQNHTSSSILKIFGFGNDYRTKRRLYDIQDILPPSAGNMGSILWAKSVCCR